MPIQSIPHHVEIARAVTKPGLALQVLDEINAHAYAAWRSCFLGQPIRLFRLKSSEDRFAYYVRTESEDLASKDPMPLEAFVAIYQNGRPTARMASTTNRLLDTALDGRLAPLPEHAVACN